MPDSPPDVPSQAPSVPSSPQPDTRRSLPAEELELGLEAGPDLRPDLQRLTAHVLHASVERFSVEHTEPAALARLLLEHAEPDVWLTEHPGVPHEAVALALLEEARQAITIDPERALAAAGLAESVLEAAPRLENQGLPTVAAIHKANASRILGDLETAAALLNAHHEKIPECQPRELRGDLNLLASSIRSDERRLPEACAHLFAAMNAYGPVEDVRRKARAMIYAGSLLQRIGDREGAIDAAESAAKLLSPKEDADLYLVARHNLANYLILTHDYDRAREVLAEIGPLYPRHGNSPYLLKFRWLCARIAAATGDSRGAAGTYEDIRERLLARGLHRNAALVTVDLARLFLDDPERFRATLDLLDATLPRRVACAPPGALRTVLEDLRASGRPSLPLLRQLARLLHGS